MKKLFPSRRAFATGALAICCPAIVRAQEKFKVSLVSTQGIAGQTLLDIAVAQGFLAQFGVEPEFLSVSDATKAIAALMGRTSDLCLWSGLGGVAVAIEKGAKLKIVGGALLSPTYAMFSARDAIHRVADLKGKVIGVGALGAQLHQVTLALLRKKGMNPADVTFRNVGSSQDVFRAVVAGTVDAGATEVDVYEQQAKYKVHSLADGDLFTEVPEFTFQAAYASDDAIARKRPALVRALAGFAKTYRYISGPDSREAWVKSYLKVSGKSDSSEAETLWQFIQKRQPYAVDLVLSSERISFMQQLNIDLAVQSRIVPYEQITDMSLAQDALKLLS